MVVMSGGADFVTLSDDSDPDDSAAVRLSLTESLELFTLSAELDPVTWNRWSDESDLAETANVSLGPSGDDSASLSNMHRFNFAP